MPGHAARQWCSMQALRGVAALMVVAFHALEQWHEAHPTHGPQRPDAWPGAVPAAGPAWPNGAAGVDLFFVISGVVMIAASARLAGRADGWRVFLCRRAERIVPLYWLATAAKLALALCVPSLARHTRPDWVNTACSFLFLPAANAAGEIRPVLPAGWTLSFEMLFYLVFAAGLALRPRDGLRGVVLRVVLPALLVLSLAGLARAPGWPAVAVLADPLVLEFGAGAMLGLWVLHPTGKPARAPAAILGLVLLAIAAALALVWLPAGTPWWRALDWGGPATLLVAALLALERRGTVRWPHALLRLGDASYAIYLAHGFVLGGLAALHLPAAWTLLAAAMALSTAAGLAVHGGIERPIAAWFARRRTGGTGRQQASMGSPSAGLPTAQAGCRNLWPATPKPAKGPRTL
ncbi:MAG: acyltransferase family protein [Janthinobacterium lividum]